VLMPVAVLLLVGGRQTPNILRDNYSKTKTGILLVVSDCNSM
jgi:hypothetical protein